MMNAVAGILTRIRKTKHIHAILSLATKLPAEYTLHFQGLMCDFSHFSVAEQPTSCFTVNNTETVGHSTLYGA